MAVTVVGSTYDIPVTDLLLFINEKTGATWEAGDRISSVVAVEVDGIKVGIRVGIENG